MALQGLASARLQKQQLEQQQQQWLFQQQARLLKAAKPGLEVVLEPATAESTDLEEVFADTGQVRPFMKRYPQYQELAARMVNLYKEITAKALENEPASPDR